MNWDDYSRLILELPYGKQLKDAKYVYLESLERENNIHSCMLGDLRRRVGATREFNVIKVYLAESKISFLSYPDFFENPHPELYASISLDLISGRVRRHDYRESENRPILHRKETLLEPDHPHRKEFATLTRAEEEEGLYAANTVIGFKRNWELLLRERGLGYSGHRLLKLGFQEPSLVENTVEVLRHKTAIVRYSLSRPMQTLLEHGLLSSTTTILDYGCGRGDDVDLLREMGYQVSGWDPVHCREGAKEPADIVNLGFVLNVIEDPGERVRVLHEAYDLSKKLLVVSTLTATSSTMKLGRPHKDGIITSRKTFQKYFHQDELERFIEDVLESPTLAVALGIFYVFRSRADHEQFLSDRARRPINWVEISRRVRPSREDVPKGRRAKSSSPRPDIYERNKDLLDAFWSKMLELGRIPAEAEFGRLHELIERCGSVNKAKNLFVRKFGTETLERAFDIRRNDLQVYLALSNFKKKVPFKDLPNGLRADVKTFLGGYRQAVEGSLALLFSAGNPEVIAKFCDETPFGYRDEQALYIHGSLVQGLHPVLRIYVGCAEVLYGDVADVDIIKIHKRSGKVSLLRYDDFDGKALPELQERIKVNLRRQSIDVFDHRSSERTQVLYYKERYVSMEHPDRAKWEAFSAWLEGLGLDLAANYGPTREELLTFLEARGLAAELEQREYGGETNEPG